MLWMLVELDDYWKYLNSYKLSNTKKIVILLYAFLINKW